MAKREVSIGGGSCLVTILGLILLWALLFGVTYKGKHYEIDCTSEHGVEVKP